MSTQSQSIPSDQAELTERYVYAATRRLPEDQRVDVGDELRASIADRVDSLLADRPELTSELAERAALEELGDPDSLASAYTGRRPPHLIGPELYAAYACVMKAVILAVVPIVTVVVSVISAIEGDSVGAIIGNAVWMAFTVAVHIAFWVTLVFALVERGSISDDVQGSLGTAQWTPDSLLELPSGSRESLANMVASIVWIAVVAVAIFWQQFSSPIGDGDGVPLLDPDLWSFWLPLILVSLLAEAIFEVVKYRIGTWSMRLAFVNVALGAVFAAPIVYLAATDRLLNPAAVIEIQRDWPGFDPGVVNTIVIVCALVIWVWDSVDGFRKAMAP